MAFKHAGSNFPQIWVSGDPTQFKSSQQQSKYSGYKVLTAFVHNQHADVLSALGETEAVTEFLGLLDKVFPPRNTRGTAQGRLATESFVKGGMMDWSQEPYIQAGCGSTEWK